MGEQALLGALGGGDAEAVQAVAVAVDRRGQVASNTFRARHP